MPNKTFFLGVHDFGFLLPGLEELLRIKQHYPNFKITCFTIPISKLFFTRENYRSFTKEKYKRWAEIVNSYDWMEIGLHGFSHTYFEMDVPYDEAKLLLKATENLLKEVGLKYKKLFVAPYWQYSYDALNALRDEDYIVALDRNCPRSIPEGLKTYIYNWSYEEKLSQEAIVKGHGHIFSSKGVKNAIDDCYQNIINQIPQDAQFGFISELASLGNQNYAKKKESC